MAGRSDEGSRDIAISGHVNVDRFLSVTAFPGPDRTVPVTDSRVELGGTATNVALVAAAHGVRVGLVSRIGEGFPPAFRHRLEQAGVDLGGLATISGATTPTCYILEDRHRRQRTLIDQGPMERTGIAPPRRWLTSYAWVHIGTGPVPDQLALAERARDAGQKVAADPAQEIFYRWDARAFRRLLATSEILFGNRAEIDRACALAGVAHVRRLLEKVPLVVRTEGRRGATSFSRDGVTRVAAVAPSARRSFVGAGDAFRGGFYGGYFAGEPLRRCLASGSRAAARWIGGVR